MPLKRNIPATGLQYDRKLFESRFGASVKVAVYTIDNDRATTTISTHDTVSAGKTARDADDSYKIAVNYWHSDWSLVSVGARQHIDAREDFPDWYDATP